MKKCRKCSKLKSVKDFYNHPKTKDKKSPNCKSCIKEYNSKREIRKVSKEIKSEINKKYSSKKESKLKRNKRLKDIVDE